MGSKEPPVFAMSPARNHLHSAMLVATLLIDLTMYALAQLITNGVIAASPVITDLHCNLGVTLWASAVLTFLLEVLVDWQKRFTER